MYTTTITDTNGCQTIDSVEVTENTGIANKKASPYLHIYPTPSSGRFTVEWKQNSSDFDHLKVINTTGKVVHRTLLTKSLNGQTTLDLSHVRSGLYFVLLEGPHEQARFKVMIH